VTLPTGLPAPMSAPQHRGPRLADPAYAILVPGADALAACSDPVELVASWVRAHGFDGLSYVAAADPTQGVDADLWTTWSGAWERRWRDAAYADVDPRLVASADRSLPCLWDGGMIVAQGRLGRFLADASTAGIRSGVAIPLRARSRAIVAFDASAAPIDRPRRDEIVAALPQLLWIAHAVHDYRSGLARGDDAGERPLSTQEYRCLALSARGLTSRDIGSRLGIAPRTVDFHVRNGAAKLGAANRHEAIAKASARGWI